VPISFTHESAAERQDAVPEIVPMIFSIVRFDAHVPAGLRLPWCVKSIVVSRGRNAINPALLTALVDIVPDDAPVARGLLDCAAAHTAKFMYVEYALSCCSVSVVGSVAHVSADHVYVVPEVAKPATIHAPDVTGVIEVVPVVPDALELADAVQSEGFVMLAPVNRKQRTIVRVVPVNDHGPAPIPFCPYAPTNTSWR
jgi:hypothetical protein